MAESLAATTAFLAETVTRLEAQRFQEWMNAEQMAAHLGMTKRAFDRIAPYLPRRYVSAQVILYPRSLVDEAILAATSPAEAIVGRALNDDDCRHADKSPRKGAGGRIRRPAI